MGVESWKVTRDLLSNPQGLDTQDNGERGTCRALGERPLGHLLGTPALRASARTCRAPAAPGLPKCAPQSCLPGTASLALCPLHRAPGMYPSLSRETCSLCACRQVYLLSFGQR